MVVALLLCSLMFLGELKALREGFFWIINSILMAKGSDVAKCIVACFFLSGSLRDFVQHSCELTVYPWDFDLREFSDCSRLDLYSMCTMRSQWWTSKL